MKTLFTLLISLALFSNCRKDVASCKDYKQLDTQENLVDPNTIDIPEFKTFLANYPYLKPYEFSSDQYSSVMKCQVFYKEIPVLTDEYVFIKSKTTNQISVTDTFRTYDLPVSTVPRISHNDAIKEAKKIMNFDHTCISYSLGIYDTHFYSAYDPNNYVLVWKIEGKEKHPLVILDATTKEVYRSTDGIIIN